MRPLPIGSYAAIGDCRTAALISRDGSLEWLCLPRFDSASVFGALLDAERGGRFAVRPVGAFEVERRYVGHTNVLETTFRTPTGVVRLVDFVAVADEEEKRRALRPDFTLGRRIECLTGEVEVEAVCDARPDYGRTAPRVTGGYHLGYILEYGARALVLRSELPLRPRTGGTALEGRATLRAGERRRLALSYSDVAPAVLPPLGEQVDEWLATTLAWWEGWAAHLRYAGPYREAVVRSALALKLLCFAPSGAVVAAPTTSLPEEIGGTSNWDYRYCWLRDASLTTAALFDLGCTSEAESFLAWMLHATRLSWPELQVLYTVYGDADVRESEIPGLAGYAGSSPVRVGNGAHDQLQLDVYGEVVNAAFGFVQRGGHLDAASARMLAGLGRSVCRRWRQPDEGIWETRGGRRHHTLSKAMCWVALDRLARLGEMGQVRVPTRAFAAECRAIRETVESHGYSEALNSYVAVFDSEEVDASLLLLGLHGYADPRSERMKGSYACIRDGLGVGPLLYRNRSGGEGIPVDEGCFGICSFWGVEQRARQGDRAGAHADFSELLGYANDVGLFAEEIDPASGAALGNFPQAFTHVGLISAALALESPPGAARHSTPAKAHDLEVRA
jgi:GH15 family glucan-1,4-alpha-glucosidase